MRVKVVPLGHFAVRFPSAIIPAWLAHRASSVALRNPRVSIDEPHVALPKLYGAPAYARPPITVAVTPRPFDPDELPIEAYRFDDDVESVAAPGETSGTNGGDTSQQGSGGNGGLKPRSFSLRRIAGLLHGGD
jgi:hypothetical protein